MPVATAKRKIATLSEAQSIDTHQIRMSAGIFPDYLIIGNSNEFIPEDFFAIGWPVGENQDWSGTGELPRVVPLYRFNVLEFGAVTRRIPFEAAPSTEIVPQEILDRLAYLAGLPPNWDGEGGAPVTQFTVERIKTLLRRAYLVAGDVLPVPFISPAHDGMLVAEWKTATGKELILDVPPDETLPGFLLVEPSPSGDEFETDAEIGDEWPIERVIHQMLAS